MTSEQGDNNSLAQHLEWLYGRFTEKCKCEHAYVSLGKLHGVNMGKGWVRTTTHPYCWHHGDAAQTHYKRTGHWYEGRTTEHKRNL